MVVWATARGPRAVPCLWGTYREAVENCDPDEFVVQVSVRPLRHLQTATRKPKGITARARAKKARADAAVAAKVRDEVRVRDGYCRYGKDDELASLQCGGRSEWAHFGEKKRFRTCGLPPMQRHTTAGSLQMCSIHHDDYDEGRLTIRALTDRGCDGPLDYEAL
jgi:hypothetical protein